MAWIFFASMYIQIMAPHKILGFSDDFNIIIFFSMLHETIEVYYMLGTLEFCIHMDQNLVLMAH